MRSKRMFLALIACMACVTAFAVGATPAQAGWTVEGVELAEGEERPVEITGEGLTLTGEVGSTKLELTSKGWHGGVVCKIYWVFGLVPVLICKFELTFTSDQKPKNCTVHSPGAAPETVITTELTGEVIMDPTAGSTATLVKSSPKTGTKWTELEFGGELCPFNELVIPVQGTATAQLVHEGAGGEKDVATKTGELFVDQSLLFSEAAQKTGGGLLYLNTNKEKPAYFDGTGHMKLSGAFAGKKFGAD